MKFRKRPVVIEASRWFKNGDHPDDYTKDEQGFDVMFPAAVRREKGWEGDVVRYYRHPDVRGSEPCISSIPCGATMHDHGWIDTPEGGHTVCPGDWIITGVAGERYPCKPAIFEATYEPAGETP